VGAAARGRSFVAVKAAGALAAETGWLQVFECRGRSRGPQRAGAMAVGARCARAQRPECRCHDLAKLRGSAFSAYSREVQEWVRDDAKNMCGCVLYGTYAGKETA
jgi:hypothetical protein